MSEVNEVIDVCKTNACFTLRRSHSALEANGADLHLLFP